MASGSDNELRVIRSATTGAIDESVHKFKMSKIGSGVTSGGGGKENRGGDNEGEVAGQETGEGEGTTVGILFNLSRVRCLAG